MPSTVVTVTIVFERVGRYGTQYVLVVCAQFPAPPVAHLWEKECRVEPEASLKEKATVHDRASPSTQAVVVSRPYEYVEAVVCDADAPAMFANRDFVPVCACEEDKEVDDRTQAAASSSKDESCIGIVAAPARAGRRRAVRRKNIYFLMRSPFLRCEYTVRNAGREKADRQKLPASP